MRKKIISFIILVCGCLTYAYSQDGGDKSSFYISTQLRTRGEYRNGVLNPRVKGALPAAFINNRTRISLGYGRENLSIGISAQHVGVWGQDAMINKKSNFIVNEAWAKINSNNGLYLKLGRQSLVYDDERLLGGLDWNVAGRYHDGLKLGYDSKNHKVDLILAFNQNDEKTIGGTYYDNSATKLYKTMQAVWYHFQSPDQPIGVSITALNIGQDYGSADTKSDTKYLQTFGTYLTFAPKSIDLSGSFYLQTGKNKAGSVMAYMGSIKAGFHVSDQWTLTAAADYLSGNDGKSSKYKAFDPLYGTHHKFYGAMDYYYASSFKAGYAPGLCDLQLGAACKVSKDLKIGLTYHNFSTAVKLENLKRALGSEIDCQIDWAIMKNVSLSAGYSTMFGSKTMEAVKGGNKNSWQDWGWISLNINPRIFSK